MPASARTARRVLVLAGGDFDPGTLDGLALEGARVVCVDRGLVHALAAGLEPALLVGDLDSVPPDVLERASLADLPRRVFPADKDASDLELALGELADGPDVPDEVVVAGVSGGRTDHLLFNWLLPASRSWPFALRLVDRSVDATLVDAARPLARAGEIGRPFSLLPFGRVDGVTTRGLRYALSGATLEAGSTLGLSNVVSAAEVGVEIVSGRLLALAVRADADEADTELPRRARATDTRATSER